MKQFLLKNKILFIIIVPISLFLIAAGFIEIDYDITTPAYLTQVQSVIEIENAYQQEGTFNTTSVFVNEHCSLLEYLFAHLNKAAIIEKSNEYIDGTSIRNSQSGTIQKENSITNAIITSFKAAGMEVSYNYEGVIIHTLATYAPENLNVGDIISEIGGISFSNLDEFIALFDELSVSPEYWNEDTKQCNLPLTVNGEEITVTNLAYGTTKEGKIIPLFGFYYYDSYEIDTENTNPQYTINKSNSGGPSGGLMSALSIYNSLVEQDLTHGLKIAGTGTIDINGNVGQIGGMYSKIYTAYYLGADVFFVPGKISDDITTDNYHEALNAYESLGSPESLKLVFVYTLQDAIDYLTTLGEQDA